MRVNKTGGELHDIFIGMRYLFVALGACLLTVGGLRLMGWAPLPETVKLDNARVRVKEVVCICRGFRGTGIRGRPIR